MQKDFFSQVFKLKQVTHRSSHSSVIVPGDSGGPVTCELNGQQKLIGLSSLTYTFDTSSPITYDHRIAMPIISWYSKSY